MMPPRSPDRDVILLHDFTSAERALGTTTARVKLDAVPYKTPDGRFVNIEKLLFVIGVDVDTDGTPSADIEAERILASFTNMELAMLGGTHILYPGGTAMDLRVPHFLHVIREQRAVPAMPSDAGATSGADVFSAQFIVPVGFAGGGDREGFTRRDALIPRHFFMETDGADSLTFDIPAEAAAGTIGAVSGVTLQSVDQLRVYAVVRYTKHPIVDALPAVRYKSTSLLSQIEQPIAKTSSAHFTEYCGLRQLATDTEALTFASAGALSIAFGAHKLHVAQTISRMTDMLRAKVNLSRPSLADRFAPITGHLPFVWGGGVVNRDGMGRTPVEWELATLGASRTSVRVLKSECHTWADEHIARGAEALGVPQDRLRSLRERVRTVDIDPELLPRRVKIG